MTKGSEHHDEHGIPRIPLLAVKSDQVRVCALVGLHLDCACSTQGLEGWVL